MTGTGTGAGTGRESVPDRVLHLDAIVFAGGRGSRLGGRDKAMLRLAGARLVDRAVDAARSAGAKRIVVVGPTHAFSDGCIGTREEPPFGGPLAALAAGLRALEASGSDGEVLLLSCDLVRPAAVVELLAAAVCDDAAAIGPAVAQKVDALVLSDPDGHSQWLAGRYSLSALRDGVEALGGDVAGRPLRAALSGLKIRHVPASAQAVADIDTPEDLDRAIAAEENEPRELELP